MGKQARVIVTVRVSSRAFPEGSHGLKSFRKGPSFLSFAASVRARNLLKPVVAAPRPNAAALASTSSREATTADTAGLMIAGGADGAVEVATEDGAIDGCLMLDPCLLKSSSMVC